MNFGLVMDNGKWEIAHTPLDLQRRFVIYSCPWRTLRFSFFARTLPPLVFGTDSVSLIQIGLDLTKFEDKRVVTI